MWPVSICTCIMPRASSSTPLVVVLIAKIGFNFTLKMSVTMTAIGILYTAHFLSIAYGCHSYCMLDHCWYPSRTYNGSIEDAWLKPIQVLSWMWHSHTGLLYDTMSSKAIGCCRTLNGPSLKWSHWAVHSRMNLHQSMWKDTLQDKMKSSRSAFHD